VGLRFENLDVETRRLMIAEFEFDLASQDGPYFSNYLNAGGVENWPRITREAFEAGTDDGLAATLANNQYLKTHVERRKPKGGFTLAAVPHTAPQTLAEAQFNLYYMRALSLRVLAGEAEVLIVYRAKAVDVPRRESELMIGNPLDPDVVLGELRRTKGVDPEINIPLPNSGLTVRLA